MSRRRPALPAPPKPSGLLLEPPSPPSRKQQSCRASAGFQSNNDSPRSSVRPEKTNGSGPCCTHCGLLRRGHTSSGCINVYPPIAPKEFEYVWKQWVLPTIDREERLARSKERLGALLDDRPSKVYIILVRSDELLWDTGVAYSLKYAADCLHPGASWPGFGTGLLVVGRTDDIVKSYLARLVQHRATPDTWEDIVVDHLKMEVELFWGEEMVAWKA